MLRKGDIVNDVSMVLAEAGRGRARGSESDGVAGDKGADRGHGEWRLSADRVVFVSERGERLMRLVGCGGALN